MKISKQITVEVEVFTNQEARDLRTAVYIAMKALDDKKLDQNLCNRLEKLHSDRLTIVD